MGSVNPLTLSKVILDPFYLHMKFGISLSISTKKISWDLIEFALNLYINVGRIGNLKLGLPIHEHVMSPNYLDLNFSQRCFKIFYICLVLILNLFLRI